MASPRHVEALIRALQFRDPQPELLRELDRAGWNRLLAYSDVARLTLILGHVWPNELPDWVHDRIARNLKDNTERFELALDCYREVAGALQAAGAQHLVLKGFAQWPYFVADVRLRTQADLDLYCPPDSLFRARDALLALGYEVGRFPDLSISDHLPLLIRAQRMSGPPENIFDPGITLAIEVHYRFWCRPDARFGPENLDLFWARRRSRMIHGLEFVGLDPLDAFAFSALHALRHLLYGGLAPYNIYELAFFLHHNAENQQLWKSWSTQPDSQLRLLTAASSLLAARWFGCRLPAAVDQEIRRLPGIVPRWFDRFGERSLVNLFEFNKDALWLHLGLIRSSRQRASVLVRRLFPFWVPSLNSRWVQESDDGSRVGPRGPLQRYATYCNWFVGRSVRHLRVLPGTLWGGLRLWSS